MKLEGCRYSASNKSGARISKGERDLLQGLEIVLKDQVIGGTRSGIFERLIQFIRNRGWINAAWLLLLPLLMLVPTINSFPYPAGDAEFSDLAITHYPSAIYLRNTILHQGEIPFWSNTILSGYPFAANPLSGLWYLPGWLALLLPLPFGFNLLIGLHLIWGGWGLSRLMEAEGLGRSAALFSGLAFAMLPKFFAHYGAGHLTLLYAVPWTPWLLYSQRIYGSENSWRKTLPAVVLSLVFLADIRWGAFAGVTWWAYAAAHTQVSWWKMVKNLLLQTFLAMLLAAPLLVPLVEFANLSSRANLTSQDVLVYSLPFLNLLGMLFPNWDTLHEWVLYSGAVVTLLAAGGLLLGSYRRGKYFWGFLCLSSLLFALGSGLPPGRLFSELPLVSLLRVPPRALFLAGMSLSSLAGHGLDAMLGHRTSNQVRTYQRFIFVVSTFAVLLVAGYAISTGEYSSDLLWGAGAVLGGGAWIWLGLKRSIPVRLWLPGVVLILVIDLVMVDGNLFTARSSQLVFKEGAQVARYIDQQGQEVRTYSPSYSIPQQTAGRHGIHMADGVDPLQIDSYTDFMEQASGVPRDGYSVTIPSFANGNPETDNRRYLPQAAKLGLLNVGYVVSEFYLDVPGLIAEKKVGDTFVYRNDRNKFPAWIQPNFYQEDEQLKPARILQRSANRIIISAVGPGILVLSEIYYPGWGVYIDGEKSQLVVMHDVLMGVSLTPGEHVVEFCFKPASVYIGLLLFALGLVVLFAIGWWYKVRGSLSQ
jgi:hypothetical protein